MTPQSLDDLLDDTDAQLAAAQEALDRGDLIDLADLPARIEAVCTAAIAARARDRFDRLERLWCRLVAVENELRSRLAAFGRDDAPDPRKVAGLYQTMTREPSSRPSALVPDAAPPSEDRRDE